MMVLKENVLAACEYVISKGHYQQMDANMARTLQNAMKVAVCERIKVYDHDPETNLDMLKDVEVVNLTLQEAAWVGSNMR